jgi:hypothetical protein
VFVVAVNLLTDWHGEDWETVERESHTLQQLSGKNEKGGGGEKQYRKYAVFLFSVPVNELVSGLQSSSCQTQS